jgi:hypothetical protein
VRFVSYPPQGYGPQGYQPYGPPPPGYGPYPLQRPSTALAYITAIVFIVCGVLSLILAIVGWDGADLDNVKMVVALVGAAFSDDVTGNLDFAISVTMSVACTTLTFALILFARLEFVRWILAIVGALVTAYYVYAIIDILSTDGGGEFVAMPLVAWLLWLGATVLAVLPATGRAMRRRSQAGPSGPPGPPGYPPAGYPPPGYPPQSTGYPPQY